MAAVLKCILIVLSMPLLGPMHAYDFCNPISKSLKLCDFVNKEHFVCNLDQVPIASKFIVLYPMTKKLVNYLLDMHNERRNLIASGKETYADKGKFPKASRMRELIWDPELAYMADVHAQRCNMAHDKCHATTKFKLAGQNLAFSASNKNKTAKEMIDYSVKAWYEEKDKIPDGAAMAEKYSSEYTQDCGHFTLMINEQVSRVGCGLSYCTGCGKKKYKKCYHLTCNYDMTNVKSYPVYKTDQKEAATKCGEWSAKKSTKYDSLCSNTGKIYDLQ